MTSKIIQEWEVTLSVTFPIKFPVEDNESEEEFRKWLRSAEAYTYIEKHLHRVTLKRWNFLLHHYATMGIDEIELKETEVKSTDTHPRV